MQIGIDIQDVKRMKQLSNAHLERIFSASEREYIISKNNAPQTIAGLYAAKEAFFKALGTGVMHSKLNLIEIKHTEQGAPFLNIQDAELGEKIKYSTLSISHTKDTAVAVVIIEKN
ncbi:MAG: holo-ACP synthase [Firmicutes bacterium]|nr:holo-ACP synthase [Bacillota bacterium]